MNPFFNYNKASTMIDIRLQTMFLIRSLQFGTSPINSSHSIHSAHPNHDPIVLKSSTISDNAIQYPEVFSYKICRNVIKDVICQKSLTFIEYHLIPFRQLFQPIIPFANGCRMNYQSPQAIRIFLASKVTSYLHPNIWSVLFMVHLLS